MDMGRIGTTAAAAAGLAAWLGGCSGESTFTFDAPESAASFVSGTGTVDEASGVATIVVALATSLPELTEELSVEIADLGSGTATAGDDYASFVATRVTFPVGSQSGATQIVNLTAIADRLVEGPDETVRLTLRNALGGAAFGIVEHVLSIEDAQEATVQFTQGTTLTADESSTTYPLSIELDLPPVTTLAYNIDLIVSDDGTGNATPGADYAAVAPQAVSFPAGSSDGASVGLSVQVLDDTDLEGAEFFALALGGEDLAQVSGGGAVRHVVSITDDEAPPTPAFTASSGPTGNETSHASGDAIDLGTQVNGVGPSVGTVVVVRNQGAGDMDLGTPVLAGSDATDFSIEVEGASNPAFSGFRAPDPGRAVDVATPFVRRAALPDGQEDPLPGVALLMDEAVALGLDGIDQVRMHGVPLPDLGDVTLVLDRRPLPIATDAVLSIDGQAVTGGPRALISDLSLWSGRVAEIPGAKAFLVLGPQGPEGRVELPFGIGRTIHVTTERPPTADGDPAQVRIVHEADLADFPAFDRPPLCGGAALVPGDTPDLDLEPLTAGTPTTSGLVTAANCRLAIETDYQLFQRFGSAADLTNYVTSLVAAVSDVYMESVQTTLSIAYLGVHTSSSDPWSTPDGSGDAGDMLDEFRAAWNASGWPVTADLAHFLSGASLGGGVAYVNVLCSQTFGYGVSANLVGNINWGTWTGNAGSFTWDFVVVAHELGHNFGASHTHEYCPPIDTCFDNCNGSTACSQGTLMSYCHTCGGMDNIDLEFHPNIANIMRRRVDASCLGDAVMQPGDSVTYRVRFGPESGTGGKAATLTFDHNAPNAADPFVLNLSGTSQ